MTPSSTPYMVYSQRALRQAYEQLQGYRVLYSLKACYRPPVLRTLKDLGAGAEVMTPMEYDLARAAGFQEIVVNGLGRSEEFLQRVAADGALIVLDCLEELERIPQTARLAARVKLDLTPFPHRLYARESKLGLTLTQLESIGRPLELLHAHVASQESDHAFFDYVVEQLNKVRAHLGSEARLNVGGGWEVYPSHFGNRGITVEPGRFLVNGAGRVVSSVVSVKSPYVVLDAGTSTLIPHKEAGYRVLEPAGGEVEVTLVDGITSLTAVGQARLALLPRTGDRIVLGDCGAYTSALAQFWAYPPMPIAFEDEQGRLEWDLAPDAVERCRRLLLGA